MPNGLAEAATRRSVLPRRQLLEIRFPTSDPPWIRTTLAPLEALALLLTLLASSQEYSKTIVTMPSIAQHYPRTDFPADLECHPLLVVDYAKIKAGDQAEVDQLYEACTNLGFFYLKNHGVEDLTEPMFEMGKATFDLPLEELMPFEQGDSGRSAGYKAVGSTNVDARGNLDQVEFINGLLLAANLPRGNVH